MYDLIIIGAGPAGLSAAVYGIRAGLDLIVIEQTPMGGGQVIDTSEVDNYLGLPGIGGFELGQKFRQHADALGVVFRSGKVVSIQDGDGEKVVETADGTKYEARALILAGGAQHAKLGVPGDRRRRCCGGGRRLSRRAVQESLPDSQTGQPAGGEEPAEQTVFL